MVSIVHKLIKTLTTNGIITRSLTSDCVSASCDNSCCGYCRMDVKTFENDHNKGQNTHIQRMLSSLEKKNKNLKKSKQWTAPSKVSVDSKHMALLASKASTDDKFKSLSQHMLTANHDDSLTIALSAFPLQNNSNCEGRKCKKKNFPELKSLPAPNNGEPMIKKVNNKIAACCEFCNKGLTLNNTLQKNAIPGL